MKIWNLKLWGLLIAYLCFFVCEVRAQSVLPYQNSEFPVEVRVNDLLKRMTLEEKIAQISHLHAWDYLDGHQLNKDKLQNLCGKTGLGFVEGFPLTAKECHSVLREVQRYMVEQTRLGIPAFVVAESLHGVVHEGATIFPQNVALGSTFNPELAYEKAACIAGELNAMGVNQVLSPCIDVVRELRWGRVEESYGEDPFLCSCMAVSEVNGYLNHGISPMLKHYGPHGNPLGGLNLASVECGSRDLFDVYLKPFEAVCKQTGVMAVMSSYNSWNRIPNSASYFMLTDVLRHRFGFRGYVYSDWGVIDMLKSFHRTATDSFEAAAQALQAGLDVEASSACFKSLVPKVQQGLFDVTLIDQAVKRVLRAKFELGLFEDPYQEGKTHKLALRAPKSVALSRKIAEESVVLLENKDGLLPLDVNKLKSIAVIGPNADHVQFGDYTWSKKKEDGITPLQGIQELVGSKVEVNYAYGCSLASLDTTGIAEAVEVARKSDVALLFVGSSSTAFVRHSPLPSTSGEGIDLHDIALTGAQETLIKQVHATGTPVVVILVTGKPFAIPWVKQHVPAILVQWYGGEQEGRAIADVLFGKVNPSGKLPFSFPQSTGHLPVYYNHLPSDKGFYKVPGTYDYPGRDYVFSSPDALWPFGHGLSYTRFSYQNCASNKMHYQPHDTIKVCVDLKNEGTCWGQEVVQLYVRDLVSSVVTPVKQLKAFSKVALHAGEEKTITLAVPVHELYLTDEKGNRYLEPGMFELQVGTSSAKILSKWEVWVGERLIAVQGECKEVDNQPVDLGQKMKVTGCVRDVQATPMAGVKVTSVELNHWVLTDEQGCYEIDCFEQGNLLFSKKHYKDIKVLLKGMKTLNFQFTQKVE